MRLNKVIIVTLFTILSFNFFVTGLFGDDLLEDQFSFANDIIPDPIEPYNRLVAGFNDKMYFYVLKPTSQGYSFVLPEQPRIGIRNFFHNITFPIRFVNNLLQLKIERAGIEVSRFVINSTLGVAGFMDPAKYCFKLDSYDEDFGQTLGTYHMSGIFHIEWPFIGPSNFRDTIGLVADFFLNPINYIPNMWIVTGLHILEKVNTTSLHLGEYEKLKKESVDYYLQIRDSYEQYRIKQIKE